MPSSSRPRTIGELLAASERRLLGVFGPGHPARLEAEILLAHALTCERTELHTHPERAPATGQSREFLSSVEARCTGRPIAHVIGEWEFYGLPFRVTEDVLVPRPETELLVDEARLRIADSERLLDIGTGSGCVAIAIAHDALARGVQLDVVATELSPKALSLAAQNATLNHVTIEFLHTDLVHGVTGLFDIIVSNPPYVASEDPALEPAVAQYEPALALRDVHDRDGLGFYRRLAREAVPLLTASGTLIVEVGETQADEVAEFLDSVNLTTSIRKDLAGIDRVVIGTRTP